MRKVNKGKIKKERGAVSTLVLFTVLMFVTILMGAYLAVTALQKSQYKSDIQIQEIYGRDVANVDEIYKELTSYAKYNEPYIPEGFKYKEGTWNSGYTIIGDTVSTGNEFVWVPCVLDQAKVRKGDTVVTFEKVTGGKYNSNNYKLLPTDTTVLEEDETVSKIKDSVGKYGGFYIAKYEAGIEGTKNNGSLTTKTPTDGSVKPLSKANCGAWDYLTREDAITVSKVMVNTQDGVKSTLISGEAWDTTMQWIVNASTNKNENTGYDIDSTGKGWYSDISLDKRHLTGYYVVNNIYDMAGNVWEWTSENCRKSDDINYIVIRGGCFNNDGLGRPAACRSSVDPLNTSNYPGFRVVLYK